MTNLQCSLSHRRMVLAATRRGRGFPGKTIGVGVDASVAMRNGSRSTSEQYVQSAHPIALQRQLTDFRRLRTPAGWPRACHENSSRRGRYRPPSACSLRVLMDPIGCLALRLEERKIDSELPQSAVVCSGPRLVREGRKLGSLRFEAALTVGARSAEHDGAREAAATAFAPCSPRDRSSRSDPGRDRPRPRCRPG